MNWVVLLVAGLFETVWALALKESHGFSKLGPTVLFLVTLVISMVLLALALRGLPVGTGYAVWTGTGAVGAAVAGMVLFRESAALGRIVPNGLVAVGIVWAGAGGMRWLLRREQVPLPAWRGSSSRLGAAPMKNSLEAIYYCAGRNARLPTPSEGSRLMSQAAFTERFWTDSYFATNGTITRWPRNRRDTSRP